MSHAINAIRKISAKRQLVDGVNNNLFDVIKYRRIFARNIIRPIFALQGYLMFVTMGNYCFHEIYYARCKSSQTHRAFRCIRSTMPVGQWYHWHVVTSRFNDFDPSIFAHAWLLRTSSWQMDATMRRDIFPFRVDFMCARVM